MPRKMTVFLNSTTPANFTPAPPSPPQRPEIFGSSITLDLDF